MKPKLRSLFWTKGPKSSQNLRSLFRTKGPKSSQNRANLLPKGTYKVVNGDQECYPEGYSASVIPPMARAQCLGALEVILAALVVLLGALEVTFGVQVVILKMYFTYNKYKLFSIYSI